MGAAIPALFLSVTSISEHGDEGTDRRRGGLDGRVVTRMFCNVSAFERLEHICESIHGDRNVRQYADVLECRRNIPSMCKIPTAFENVAWGCVQRYVATIYIA
ncbi:hypothetical protein FBR07_04585 [Candidatus Uhrbacteria bacterium UHB]|nr:hypothetical protein [Candidatus Uhrbacteria bacterium UHB]